MPTWLSAGWRRNGDLFFPVVLSAEIAGPGDRQDRQRVLLEGLYHPQVKNAVANTVKITGDQPVIFLRVDDMAARALS